MVNLNKAEESSLDLRLKQSILKSLKILGCRLSEFEVVNACQKPVQLDDYWVDFVWESERNLRMLLTFEDSKAHLTQTFENTPSQFLVRLGTGLTPVFQFSPEGICYLTQHRVQQVVQQFSELPALPLSETDHKVVNPKVAENTSSIPPLERFNKVNPDYGVNTDKNVSESIITSSDNGFLYPIWNTGNDYLLSRWDWI